MAVIRSVMMAGALALGMSLVAGCSSAHIKRTEVGYAAYYDGDLEQAEEDFNAALKKSAGFEPALTGLGLVAYERGQYKEAYQLFNDAISADRTPEALYGRGMANLKLFQWEEARQDLSAAVDGGLAEANLELGMALMLVGDGAEALSAIKAFASVPEVPAARQLTAAAVAYRAGLKFDMAAQAIPVVEAYRFGADLPEAPEHARLLIDLAIAAGDPAQALKVARGAPADLGFGFGFRELSPVAARTFEGIGGAVIDYVHLGSPAEKGGLQAGDILTGFEAFPVESAASLQASIMDFRAQVQQNQVALFEVLRGDTYYAASMKLGDFDFDTRIREVRDAGSDPGLDVARDDLALWP